MLRIGVNWKGAPDSALPTTDPHGRALDTLSTAELREMSGWCMTPEYHEAVRRARGDLLASLRAIAYGEVS